MSWGIFTYKGDDADKATCIFDDTKNYDVKVDNSHNGECLTGVPWRMNGVSGGQSLDAKMFTYI